MQSETVGHRPEEAFAADQDPRRHGSSEDVPDNHRPARDCHRITKGATHMDEDLGDQEQSDVLAGGQLSDAQQPGYGEHNGE